MKSLQFDASVGDTKVTLVIDSDRPSVKIHVWNPEKHEHGAASVVFEHINIKLKGIEQRRSAAETLRTMANLIESGFDFAARAF